MKETKSRILYILKFLWQNTDSEHYATTADIIAYLNDNYISCDRKTIPNDIAKLCDFGIDTEAYNQRLSFLHDFIEPCITKQKQTSKVKKQSITSTLPAVEQAPSQQGIFDTMQTAKSEGKSIVKSLKEFLCIEEIPV